MKWAQTNAKWTWKNLAKTRHSHVYVCACVSQLTNCKFAKMQHTKQKQQQQQTKQSKWKLKQQHKLKHLSCNKRCSWRHTHTHSHLPGAVCGTCSSCATTLHCIRTTVIAVHKGSLKSLAYLWPAHYRVFQLRSASKFVYCFAAAVAAYSIVNKSCNCCTLFNCFQ